MLGLRPDALHVRAARVHGAHDELRARQRFESAVAGLALADLGLPPSALLVVRSVAPSVRLPTEAHASPRAFAVAVRESLHDRIARARSPVRHADASTADAVLFADEGELLACFILDGLRSRFGQHWWWTTLFRGTSPSVWGRKFVLSRGEVLPAVLTSLAPHGHAREWIARLDLIDVAITLTGIVSAHALASELTSGAPAPVESRVRGRASTFPALLMPEVAGHRAADERLRTIAPERETTGLCGARARLLTIALIVARSPEWARTSECAGAVLRQRFDAATTERAFPRIAEQSHARTVPMRGEMRDLVPSYESPPAPPVHADVASAQPSYPDQSAAHETKPQYNPSRRRSRAAHADALEATKHANADEYLVLASSSTNNRLQGPPPSSSEAAFDHSVNETRTVAEDVAPVAPTTSTRYGGILYLLNAALALGLYADFTLPRAANLALSPWNLLALLGRAWMGRSFVRDPIWRLLASLAGREAELDPAHEFTPPHDRWLEQLHADLDVRLGAALGTRSTRRARVIVAKHPARIAVSIDALDVHLSLSKLPLPIRIAGLDRDTGWIPAAGRSVRFHFT